MKVLGMGNALVDVLVLMDDDNMLKDIDLPKGSMQLIDAKRKAALDSVINTKEKHIAAGGSASNTIVGLSKLGIQTGFLGRIGKDIFGEYYKNDLVNHGVTPYLSISDTEASGVATTFISADGQRTFGTFLGAAATLTASDLKDEDFIGYDYFYIEGYLVQNLDLIRKAITLAKENGLKVVLDLASYNVVETVRDFLLEIIPQYVDVIFANEDEAKALLGVEPEEALQILSEQVKIAIVKIGEEGSWVQKGAEKVFIPALQVNCIDTTGAGDLYASGFLYGLINNLSLKRCGELGTLLAGSVVQIIGPKIQDEEWCRLIQKIDC